jgi:hypothetical protein
LPPRSRTFTKRLTRALPVHMLSGGKRDRILSKGNGGMGGPTKGPVESPALLRRIGYRYDVWCTKEESRERVL